MDALHHFRDAPQAVAGMARVLSPRFTTASWGRPTSTICGGT